MLLLLARSQALVAYVYRISSRLFVCAGCALQLNQQLFCSRPLPHTLNCVYLCTGAPTACCEPADCFIK